MPSFILPPSVHYGVFLPFLSTRMQCEEYQIIISEYQSFLRLMLQKFKYGTGSFRNVAYYKKLQYEYMQMEEYQKEIEDRLAQL